MAFVKLELDQMEVRTNLILFHFIFVTIFILHQVELAILGGNNTTLYVYFVYVGNVHGGLIHLLFQSSVILFNN